MALLAPWIDRRRAIRVRAVGASPSADLPVAMRYVPTASGRTTRSSCGGPTTVAAPTRLRCSRPSAPVPKSAPWRAGSSETCAPPTSPNRWTRDGAGSISQSIASRPEACRRPRGPQISRRCTGGGPPSGGTGSAGLQLDPRDTGGKDVRRAVGEGELAAADRRRSPLLRQGDVAFDDAATVIAATSIPSGLTRGQRRRRAATLSASLESPP